jgi:hypothetical protein
MQAQRKGVVEGVQTHLGFVFVEMGRKIVADHFQKLLIIVLYGEEYWRVVNYAWIVLIIDLSSILK